MKQWREIFFCLWSNFVSLFTFFLFFNSSNFDLDFFCDIKPRDTFFHRNTDVCDVLKRILLAVFIEGQICTAGKGIQEDGREEGCSKHQQLDKKPKHLSGEGVVTSGCGLSSTFSLFLLSSFLPIQSSHPLSSISPYFSCLCLACPLGTWGFRWSLKHTGPLLVSSAFLYFYSTYVGPLTPLPTVAPCPPTPVWCVMVHALLSVLETCLCRRWRWARWSPYTGRSSRLCHSAACTALLSTMKVCFMYWGAAVRLACPWTVLRSWMYRARHGARCHHCPQRGQEPQLWHWGVRWWCSGAWISSRHHWPLWRCIILMRANGKQKPA